MVDDAQKAKRPSIYDVAQLAGVSHMTVSRVLNHYTNIKPETKSKVMAAVKETGYRPSSAARALATQRAMRIGVLVHAPTQYGPQSTLIAIERAAREAGYGVCTFSASSKDDTELERAIADLEAQGIDALCVIGPGSSSSAVLKRQAAVMPVVIVGLSQGHPGLLSVAVDQSRGAEHAMEHLLGLGHRTILHVAGPLDTADAQGREAAWRAAIRSIPGEREHILLGDWSSAYGFEVGSRHELIDRVTAVFAANDQMALGLLHGLWTRGIRVPEDISVVGFDDVPEAPHFIPPLTTVRQDFDALGAAVLETVVAALHGEFGSEAKLIPAELVVRSSTAPRRSHRLVAQKPTQ